MAVFSHLLYTRPFQGPCDGYLEDSLTMALWCAKTCWRLANIWWTYIVNVKLSLQINMKMSCSNPWLQLVVLINSPAALLTFSISNLRGCSCCCQGTPGVLVFKRRCNDWQALHSNWAWRACLSFSARAVAKRYTNKNTLCTKFPQNSTYITYIIHCFSLPEKCSTDILTQVRFKPTLQLSEQSKTMCA